LDKLRCLHQELVSRPRLAPSRLDPIAKEFVPVIPETADNCRHAENMTEMPRFSWLDSHADSLQWNLEGGDICIAPCLQRPPRRYPLDSDDDAISKACLCEPQYPISLDFERNPFLQLDETYIDQKSVGNRALTKHAVSNDITWMEYYMYPAEVLSWTRGSTGMKKCKSKDEPSQSSSGASFGGLTDSQSVKQCGGDDSIQLNYAKWEGLDSGSDSESERKEIQKLVPNDATNLSQEEGNAMLAKRDGVRLKYAKKRRESWFFRTESEELRELEKLERAFSIGFPSAYLSQAQVATRHCRMLHLRIKYDIVNHR